MPLLLPPFTLHRNADTRADAPMTREMRALRVRLLRAQDLPSVAALRHEVLATLQHPDCYVREADEASFMRLHHPPHGETIGVFSGDVMVAYAMLGLPEVGHPDNLGAALGLTPEGRKAVAHLSSCMVRPAWRGLGLQRTLLGTRLALARSRGRHLCAAVVSLHNHSSRHNMLRRGLHVAGVELVDGLRRQITLIDLDHGLQVDQADQEFVDSDDFIGQRDAVSRGYVGVGEVRGPQQVRLRFVRRLDRQAVPL